MKRNLGVVCGVAAVALLLIPTGSDLQPPIPPDDNQLNSTVEVDQAFDTYKRLWLKHNLEAASKLDSGELTTDQETWDFLASGQEAARKVAFKEIGDKEQEVLGDEWTAEKHSKILKGYVK